MAKQTIQKINQDDSVPAEKLNLTELSDKVLFKPNSNQRRIKAQFWSRYTPGPFSNPDRITLAEVMQVTRSKMPESWWPAGGFQEWFMNRDEGRERLEYLFMKALDTAEDIMDNPEVNGNAKVQMIKVIAELANKFPSKFVEKYSDDDINRMDDKQLRNYLERKGIKFTEEKVIEINDETTQED